MNGEAGARGRQAERRSRTRDSAGDEPAPTRWIPPGPRPSTPAALSAASGSVREGHRLPFPSGGAGGGACAPGRPLLNRSCSLPPWLISALIPCSTTLLTFWRSQSGGRPGMHDSPSLVFWGP